ncbi:MAG: NUDIX hydrolase [Bacteroidetes bacterium]|nr:NUDIX hydrolase [Bacteroidota bacterium]
MLKHWEKISSKIVFKNSWWTYKQDYFQIPNGIRGEYHYVHTLGASMIVPVTDEGKIILVKQYRFLCDRESIELPCGGVKEGMTYEETAHLEMEEETGFRAGKLEYAAEYNPYNGVTDEICKVYVASDLHQTKAIPDNTEEFEILYKHIHEVDELIRSNEIWDGMTIAAWGLTKHLL